MKELKIEQNMSFSIEQVNKLKLENKQLEIYNGLKDIGPEISEFYLDGIKIINYHILKSKANVIAHLAREIDGGLRDIFSSDVEKKKIQSKLKKVDLGELTENKGHMASILTALNCDMKNQYAVKWANIATKFARIAHRHGAYKSVKDSTEIESLWKEYEEILHWLVGSYYNLLNRVDRILKYEEPSEEIIKSLPKFLEVNARYLYFFRNLKSTKWLIPLYNAGFFNPNNNPLPIEDPDNKGFFSIPHWPILYYLENAATNNQIYPSKDISNLLLKIIEDITEYRDEHGNRIDNSNSDWYLIKILFLLPIELISEKHINYFKLMIDSRWRMTLIESEIGKTILPKLISNSSINLITRLLDIMFEYVEPEKSTPIKFTSKMQKFWLNDSIKKHKASIAKLCGLEAGQIAINMIHKIIQIDDSQFNHIWIPTIEDHPQKRLTDQYECQLVHFIRDMYEHVNPNNISVNIGMMLVDDHPIFQRISLHIISFHYDSLKDIFWEWENNPLDDFEIRHEVYELFNSNCTKFTEKQIEQILYWIESKEYFISEKLKDDKEMKNKILAYRKKAWLTSLLPSKNHLVQTAYKKYNKIDPKIIEQPGFITGITSWSGSISSLSEDQLLKMSINDIVNYLNNFKEESGWKKPSIDGLTNALRSCVSKNPEKFSKNLKPFLKIQRFYQNSILQGFSTASQNKNNIMWDNLFDFIVSIINSENFWSEEFDETINDYRKWIISQIADLINNGTKNDDYAFDPQLLPVAESILLKLINQAEYDLFFSLNLITSVLNSSKGKILSAMINYSLRIARLSNKAKDRWILTIKKEFNKRIHKEIKPSIEFYVTLGEYLPNLLYLDENWVTENINLIFPFDSDDNWEASFTSYLYYHSKIYKNIYFLLRDNNHYEKAINIKFADEGINEALVQHICVGYIENWEDINKPDSLISKLLEQQNMNLLSEIVRFFWISHENQTKEMKAKVIIMWRALINLLSNIEVKKEVKAVISDLSKWLVFIDKIDDEISDWILLSAKYIKSNYNTSYLIEYLVKHAIITPEKVANIYLFMLKEKIFPDYDQKHIMETIQCLYDHGQKNNADEICNLYGKNGFDFLRAIYLKNNKINA